MMPIFIIADGQHFSRQEKQNWFRQEHFSSCHFLAQNKVDESVQHICKQNVDELWPKTADSKQKSKMFVGLVSAFCQDVLPQWTSVPAPSLHVQKPE